MFIAHKRENEVQTLQEHLENVAEYSADNLKDVGLKNTGHLVGILHDMGKYTTAFQNYIVNGGTKGTVVHTFQGCRYILSNFHADGAPGYKDVTAELLAYAIGSHHGMFDLFGESKESGFEHRIKEDDDYNEAVTNFENEIATADIVRKWFETSDEELQEIYSKIDCMSKNYEELCFYFSQLSRLILSGVIDADRRDTAEYMQEQKLQHNCDNEWLNKLEFLECKLNQFDQSTPINQARRTISDICKEKSVSQGNIFRLNVPTGGSKTLSSLRFALARCEALKKKRIIFTAPLISILEQNSKVIHEFVGDDSGILDHYSNAIQEDGRSEQLDKNELLAEDWNAPIIITSLVQLLNTLFAGKTTSIRRYQALCNSVIIIDEVQTVPTKMLSLFNLAVNFLSTICNTTFVLCSATQPCFEDEKAEHPMITSQTDIVEYDEKIWNIFRRTQIIPKGDMSLDRIAEFALEILDHNNNLLIICNKKNEAVKIYELLNIAGIKVFHLSSSNCMAHRRQILSEVGQYLSNKEKVVLVSTQVIEAGVDISFECVIRLQAGIDSVIQAAGRCNRNGEMNKVAEVYLINYPAENLSHLAEIKRAKDATNQLLYEYTHGRFGDANLTSDQTVKFYYQSLFASMNQGYQNFTVNGTTIFELLSTNNQFVAEAKDCDKYFLRQAMETAGKYFKVFDDDTVDVVVPYKLGKELITELCSLNEYNTVELKAWIMKAKPYMVSLYEYQLKKFERCGLLYSQNGVMVLKEGGYGEIGVTDSVQNNEIWEV